jgi:hypothetical protein
VAELSLRSRITVAVVATVLLVGGALGYALAVQAKDNVTPVGTVSLAPGPRLLVLAQRHVASVSATDPAEAVAISDVECVRVYAAGGTGVCLRQDNAWSYSLVTLSDSLEEQESFRIQGLPNRARVSASGRMVSWTTFIGGESYNRGGFSTRTGILDTRTGERMMSLEDFDVTVDGRSDNDVDHNFWGVTFADDDNRFFATMSTDGERHLVEGDFAARTLRTVKPNVECPSLSSDGTRIAFKQAIGNDPRRGWRLSVLRLSDLSVTHLAETRSIDDQAAWLSDDTVGYTVRSSDGTPSVWSVPADGSGRPTLVRDDAESPAALGG